MNESTRATQANPNEGDAYEWLYPYHENHATGWYPPVDDTIAATINPNVVIIQLDCSSIPLNRTVDGFIAALQRPPILLHHLKLLHYAAALTTTSIRNDDDSNNNTNDNDVHIIIHGCDDDRYRTSPLNGILTHNEQRHHWPSLHVRHWMISRSLLYQRTRIGLRSASVHALDDNDMVAWPVTRHQNRYAYAAVMHSSDSFLCGALVLAHSIHITKTTIPLVRYHHIYLFSPTYPYMYVYLCIYHIYV